MARHAKGRRRTVAAPADAEQVGLCLVCCSPTPRLMRRTARGWKCPVCLEAHR